MSPAKRVERRLGSSRWRVILADDHPVVRDGLRHRIEAGGAIEVIAEAGDGRTLLRQVQDLNPDVAVVDISMPELDGIEVTRRIASQHPSVRVLILSMHCDEASVLGAIEAGAAGYVVKEAPPEELHKAIEAVACDNTYFSPAVVKLLANHVADRGRTGARARLTAREREVVRLIGEGGSVREVAARLFVSPHTVKSHRANAMRKLGCRTTAALIRYVITRGLASA